MSPFRIFLTTVDFAVGTHPFVVEIFMFCDIADVELDCSEVFFVADFEIVPICMSTGVCVATDEAVVLLFFYANCEI